MHLILIGGSGFIGRALSDELLGNGHELTLVTRSPRYNTSLERPGLTVVGWDGTAKGSWTERLETSDGVINLAGESIGGKRWSKRQKNLIRSSRVETTRAIVEAITKSRGKGQFLINASAVGYYGNVPEGDVTESHPCGRGFLAEVCSEWENSLTTEGLSPLSPLGPLSALGGGMTRFCTLRTGIVLSPAGGALQKFIPPYRLFIGGPIGSGCQWLPWIHITDAVRAIRFLLEHSTVSGPFNLTAPMPVTMDEFAHTIGLVLRRPSVVRVPASALRMLLGEMAGPLVLEGQRAIPRRLLEMGFEFIFPSLESALRDLLRREKF
jgi:uncharacterized protein (TIGR01777 family)